MLSKLVAVALLVGSALSAPTLSLEKLKLTNGPVVQDSYIVVLKEGISKAAKIQSLNDLVFAQDDTTSFKEVTHAEWEVVNGYAAKLGGAALQHVLTDPDVDYVEPNGIVSIKWTPAEPEAATVPSPTVPRADVEVSEELAKRAAGSGVDVYSIDTGVLITHQCFGGRARWGAVFGGYPQQDGNGHGTHTASTVAGSGFGPATSAAVIAVKVLSDSGSGTNADVISGVNFVTTSARSSGRPSVANMSLGGSASSTLDTAVSNSIAAGVHYTIAAGNSDVDASTQSPARVAVAVTVGAIDSNRAKASFSNFGSVVDVWFLGVNKTAAWIGSNTATNTISGTSMAAPGVGGILAVAISNHGNSSPATLQANLKAAAVHDVTGVPSGTTTGRAVQF